MENELVSRVQPNDTIAEQAVLGSMLVDKDAVIAAVEILVPDDFYREDNKEIYAAMMELYGLGRHIDMITIIDQLKLRGSYERVGETTYIATLIDNVPTTSNIESYVKIVEEKSVIRKLIKVANDILKMGYSQSEEVDTIIEQTEKRVFDVLQDRNNRGYSSLKEVLVTAFDTIEKMYQSKNKVSGVESGFVDLDLKISGLNPSSLIILAARPAMGKSAFALNIAEFVAMHAKTPVMVFSLEMSKEEIANRMLSSESEVDSMKIKNGNDLTSEDWLKLGQASGRLSDIPLYIDDTPGLSSAELRAKCRKAKLEKNIGLVVIDYLQLMESKTKSPSRQQEISEISRSLKILAKELQIPVIALSQLSRATESRTDHKPMLSDLRESGAIEQDADIVMFLHREDYYNPETEKKNIAEVIIAKNRSGSTGSVEVAWIGQYTKFANLYRGPEQ
ncbi:MAG: replicative DNA helicase [Clostridia bacterium]|nr:replicative DNA helicase [Clostridia bacterium]